MANTVTQFAIAVGDSIKYQLFIDDAQRRCGYCLFTSGDVQQQWRTQGMIWPLSKPNNFVVYGQKHKLWVLQADQVETKFVRIRRTFLQMPPRILAFFLYINQVTTFMLVFKSTLHSKKCLPKEESILCNKIASCTASPFKLRCFVLSLTSSAFYDIICLYHPSKYDYQPRLLPSFYVSPLRLKFSAKINLRGVYSSAPFRNTCKI